MRAKNGESEIPLFLILFYLFCESEGEHPLLLDRRRPKGANSKKKEEKEEEEEEEEEEGGGGGG